MQLLAVSLLLALGASATGSAAPAPAPTARPARAPTSAADTDGWVEIGSTTPASNGREHFAVSPRAGAFTRLRIDVRLGRPDVEAIVIDYRDGTRRTVQIEAVLDHASRPSVFVDLRGPHEIDSFIVRCDTQSRGSYSVYAIAEVAGIARR